MSLFDDIYAEFRHASYRKAPPDGQTAEQAVTAMDLMLRAYGQERKLTAKREYMKTYHKQWRARQRDAQTMAVLAAEPVAEATEQADVQEKV